MPFEISSDPVNGKKGSYLLCYKVGSWPGVFSRTECVQVMSRYCIVNYSDEALEVCQEESFSSPVSSCIRNPKTQLYTRYPHTNRYYRIRTRPYYYTDDHEVSKRVMTSLL